MRRQVVVGALLPAGRPDELVALGEAPQPLPGLVGDAVGDAVDQLEAPGHLVERPVEAEQADRRRRRRAARTGSVDVAPWR